MFTVLVAGYGTWCNAPEVFVGETAKITFYMDNATKCIYLEGQFINCSSLEVQFINSTNKSRKIRFRAYFI